jgi:hypothetical protein
VRLAFPTCESVLGVRSVVTASASKMAPVVSKMALAYGLPSLPSMCHLRHLSAIFEAWLPSSNGRLPLQVCALVRGQSSVVHCDGVTGLDRGRPVRGALERIPARRALSQGEL